MNSTMKMGLAAAISVLISGCSSTCGKFGCGGEKIKFDGKEIVMQPCERLFFWDGVTVTVGALGMPVGGKSASIGQTTIEPKVLQQAGQAIQAMELARLHQCNEECKNIRRMTPEEFRKWDEQASAEKRAILTLFFITQTGNADAVKQWIAHYLSQFGFSRANLASVTAGSKRYNQLSEHIDINIRGALPVAFATREDLNRFLSAAADKGEIKYDPAILKDRRPLTIEDLSGK